MRIGDELGESVGSEQVFNYIIYNYICKIPCKNVRNEEKSLVLNAAIVLSKVFPV